MKYNYKVFKKCLNCKGKFYKHDTHCSIKQWGKRKNCSIRCSAIANYTYRFGKDNHSWSENPSSLGIHKWLYREYGKADKCENPECPQKPVKRYEWSLLHGKNYERKRKNFWKLCSSCHKVYDKIHKNFNSK